MEKLDSAKFKTPVQNNKKHLGEFLDHFDNMLKFPEKVENNGDDRVNQEEYRNQLISYKDEMDKKIVELKKSKYNNSEGRNEMLEACGENLYEDINFVGNERMQERLKLLRKCIYCKKTEHNGGLLSYPFEMFDRIYQGHFMERNKDGSILFLLMKQGYP